jgi:hypothetical protein
MKLVLNVYSTMAELGDIVMLRVHDTDVRIFTHVEFNRLDVEKVPNPVGIAFLPIG